MIELTSNETDSYLADFVRLEAATKAPIPPWLQQRRRSGASQFAELGFPTSQVEEWKYTDVTPIVRTAFSPAQHKPNGLQASQLSALTFGNLNCPRLVFVNGFYSSKLSSLQDLPEEVQVRSLAEVLKGDPSLAEPYLARHAKCAEHAFVSLNTAFIQDGAFVYVSPGASLVEPIHLLYLSTAGEKPVVAHPRNLIVIGQNSQAAILESYVGLQDKTYFTNLVTEIVAEENSIVDHYKLHQESKEAFHVSTLQLYQGRGSSLRSLNVTLGGLLTRNEVNAVLDGEGCECTLNGLYLLSDDQHVDNHTRLEHAQSHCDSRELYKGILNGKSSGVFHGRIVVQPGAQKTDSKQTNNNLLLSDNALVNSKPQLEIYADDVKCTHGATIGQLSEDALFYLRCRGIDHKTARSLLIYAFASEVVSSIKVDSVRIELDEYLFDWLPRGHLVREAV